MISSGFLDLDFLLPFDNPQIWSHVEFDLSGICAVRHHDGRIAYAASAKFHLLFGLDFIIFDKT